VPGHPDLVIRSRKLAIFVDGDFWHGNAWRLRGLPNLAALFPNRTAWWVAKIERNVQRDLEVTRQLESKGWRVIRVWESDILADPENAGRRVLEQVWQL
jgi:DNA mismatch endonuclease (patch repair protein)